MINNINSLLGHSPVKQIMMNKKESNDNQSNKVKDLIFDSKQGENIKTINKYRNNSNFHMDNNKKIENINSNSKINVIENNNIGGNSLSGIEQRKSFDFTDEKFLNSKRNFDFDSALNNNLREREDDFESIFSDSNKKLKDSKPPLIFDNIKNKFLVDIKNIPKDNSNKMDLISFRHSINQCNINKDIKTNYKDDKNLKNNEKKDKISNINRNEDSTTINQNNIKFDFFSNSQIPNDNKNNQNKNNKKNNDSFYTAMSFQPNQITNTNDINFVNMEKNVEMKVIDGFNNIFLCNNDNINKFDNPALLSNNDEMANIFSNPTNNNFKNKINYINQSCQLSTNMQNINFFNNINFGRNEGTISEKILINDPNQMTNFNNFNNNLYAKNFNNNIIEQNTSNNNFFLNSENNPSFIYKNMDYINYDSDKVKKTYYEMNKIFTNAINYNNQNIIDNNNNMNNFSPPTNITNNSNYFLNTNFQNNDFFKYNKRINEKEHISSNMQNLNNINDIKINKNSIINNKKISEFNYGNINNNQSNKGSIVDFEKDRNIKKLLHQNTINTNRNNFVNCSNEDFSNNIDKNKEKYFDDCNNYNHQNININNNNEINYYGEFNSENPEFKSDISNINIINIETHINNISVNVEDDNIEKIANQFLYEQFSKGSLHWLISSKEVGREKQIGFGGSSEVYKGDYRGTEVAIKKLRIIEVNDENLKEFKREVSSLIMLRHPNLVLFMGAM